MTTTAEPVDYSVKLQPEKQKNGVKHWKKAYLRLEDKDSNHNEQTPENAEIARQDSPDSTLPNNVTNSSQNLKDSPKRSYPSPQEHNIDYFKDSPKSSYMQNLANNISEYCKDSPQSSYTSPIANSANEECLDPPKNDPSPQVSPKHEIVEPDYDILFLKNVPNGPPKESGFAPYLPREGVNGRDARIDYGRHNPLLPGVNHVKAATAPLYTTDLRPVSRIAPNGYLVSENGHDESNGYNRNRNSSSGASSNESGFSGNGSEKSVTTIQDKNKLVAMLSIGLPKRNRESNNLAGFERLGEDQYGQMATGRKRHLELSDSGERKRRRTGETDPRLHNQRLQQQSLFPPNPRDNALAPAHLAAMSCLPYPSTDYRRAPSTLPSKTLPRYPPLNGFYPDIIVPQKGPYPPRRDGYYGHSPPSPQSKKGSFLPPTPPNFCQAPPSTSSADSRRSSFHDDDYESETDSQRQNSSSNIIPDWCKLSRSDIRGLDIDNLNDKMAKAGYDEQQIIAIRDIRRKLKNRVAARNSRKKRMEGLDELRQTEADLKEENDNLVQDIQEIKTLNQKIMQVIDEVTNKK